MNMTRHAWIMTAVVAAGLLGGCNQPLPGSSRQMDTVDYPAAFASAREVMAQYYAIESANVDAGLIQARPKEIDAPKERVLSGSAAREVASMRLRKEGKGIVAYAAVAVQRQGGNVLRQMRPGTDSYTSVPNQTPAEHEAATTVQQNESWRTLRYAHDVEARILQDLYRSLHPAEK
jgi:hypothetical protein